VLQAGDFVL
jgi:hypothetical protein